MVDTKVVLIIGTEDSGKKSLANRMTVREGVFTKFYIYYQGRCNVKNQLAARSAQAVVTCQVL